MVPDPDGIHTHTFKAFGNLRRTHLIYNKHKGFIVSNICHDKLSFLFMHMVACALQPVDCSTSCVTSCETQGSGLGVDAFQ